MYVMSLLQAAAPQGSLLSMMLPIALIFVIFYVFIIRPQNKKQKETQKMIEALKKGDKIITIGGIHGTISSTKEQTVIVKVDDNTKIEFTRSAIATVVVDKPAKADEKSDEKKSLFGKAKKSAEEKSASSTADKNGSAEK
ncbi:preprotein translocase subunit YajC [Treponema sp. OMZ 840]|uniref:preprotein translocase subunit YajC n=1 Tax=Treponema sp. OMZ 840 TaxID=244313 RepID=UPI003D8B37D5